MYLITDFGTVNMSDRHQIMAIKVDDDEEECSRYPIVLTPQLTIIQENKVVQTPYGK